MIKRSYDSIINSNTFFLIEMRYGNDRKFILWLNVELLLLRFILEILMQSNYNFIQCHFFKISIFFTFCWLLLIFMHHILFYYFRCSIYRYFISFVSIFNLKNNFLLFIDFTFSLMFFYFCQIMKPVLTIITLINSWKSILVMSVFTRII